MRILYLIACVGLLAIVSSKITPKVTPNITVYHKDSLQFNLSYVFDLDYASGLTCTSKSGSLAEYVIPNNSISTKDISNLGFMDNPEITKLVSNNTVFAVYDNSQILIQSLTVDQLRFGETHQKYFGRPGAEAMCSDIVYNKVDGILYVGCYSKQSDKNPNSILTIKRLNDTTGDEIKPAFTVQLNDDSQKMRHKLSMQMVTLKAGNINLRGLILYDQGFSSGQGNYNKWAWVLSIGASGTLASYNVVDLPEDFKLTSVYDFFGVRDAVIITGKNSTILTDKIYMSWCTIDVSGIAASFECNNLLTVAPFGTYYGYLGTFNTGQYVEINADPNHADQDLIHICNFKGVWGADDFIDKESCSSIESYHIPDDVSIDDVEGNVHQVVVKYTHFDGTYAGYSAHNFDLRFEWSRIDDSKAHHVLPLGKSLMALNQTHLDIHRMVSPYFYLAAEGLAPGNNIIRIDCQDDTTPKPVSGMLNVYMIESMKDGVTLNGSLIHDFSVYDGERFMFQLDPKIVLGNDIQVSVHFDAKVEPYVIQKIYDTEFTNINWKTTNTSIDFTDIHFAGKYAVTKDTRGWVSFHNCYFAELAIINCVEKGSYNMGGHNIVLKKDLNEVFSWQFSWAVDPIIGSTFIFIFDGSRVHRHLIHASQADDCMMTEIGSNAYLSCSFQKEGMVRGVLFPQMNPSADPYPVEAIHRGNSEVEYFCPTDIDFHPQLNNILEVLSVCEGQDQRILRYKYPPQVNPITKEMEVKLIDDIPINFAYQNPQICSMGSEYIQFSMINGKTGDLQSRSTSDDRNVWSFGTLTDDLNLGEIYKLNCIARSGMFVGLFRTEDRPELDSLAVFWGNQQYQANNKLYNARRDNLHHYNFIDSYELLGQVVHVLHDADSNSFDFMVTFTKGQVVDIKFEHGAINLADAQGKIPMTLSFSNGGSFRQDIAKTVEIVSTKTEVKVSTKKKISSNAAGIIDLEDYIDIKGPVAEAYIKNTTGVHLIGRLHATDNHAPVERDAGTFAHLETFGTTTLGVRTTDANVSTFVIFHKINEFVGEYTPAHGVNAYHFATFNNDSDTILIAYSTAEAADNTLQFVTLKGNSRMSIGFSKPDAGYNFTMIRVIPLTDADSFLVLASGSDHVVHHLRVTVTGTQIKYTELETIPHVHDFGWVAPQNADKIYAIYSIDSDFKGVEIAMYDKKSGKLTKRVRDSAYKNAIKKLSGVDADVSNYNIVSLFAKVHNDTSFYVILNTESPYIVEIIYDTANEIHDPQTFKYMKVPGYSGRYMAGNLQNFVIETMGDIASMDHGARYYFYNRQIQTNNGSIYPVWSYHNDIPRPFTLTNCPHNNSHFQVTTPFDTVPLVFLRVAPMQLNVTDPSALKNAILEFDGSPHQESSEIKIGDIISDGRDDEDKKALPWWPFALLIGILVALSVGFIIYKGHKDKAMQAGDPENYISLKPAGKDDRPSESDA
jgi:hypothetical protein